MSKVLDNIKVYSSLLHMHADIAFSNIPLLLCTYIVVDSERSTDGCTRVHFCKFVPRTLSASQTLLSFQIWIAFHINLIILFVAKSAG